MSLRILVPLLAVQVFLLLKVLIAVPVSSAHKRANAVPDPYLPLTEEFGGRRQYRFNLAGQIFLQTGGRGTG